MKTTKKTRWSRKKIKTLSARKTSTREAKAVKGGLGQGKHPLPPGPARAASQPRLISDLA
jgi:hypothetical protein